MLFQNNFKYSNAKIAFFMNYVDNSDSSMIS